MRGKVVVDSESDYQSWLQQQKTFAQLTTHTTQAQATEQSRPGDDRPRR
jgi:cytochrome c oxidase subunit 2